MYCCLECKYEPDWSEPSGHRDYSCRTGKCKFKMEWPPYPWVYLIQTRPLIRYSDDSGLPTSCKTFEKREVQ